MANEIEVQVQTARSDCATARNAAALPLVFTSEAAQRATDRDQDQLRASLPQIPGGWPTVKDAVLRAVALSGTLAKDIAQFHDSNATEITVEQMLVARGVAERECKLNLATLTGMDPDEVNVSQGLVCG